MKRPFLFLTLGLLLASAQAPKKFAVRKPSDEFVGAWKLISLERRTAAGAVTYPLGEHPVGRLTYDAMGRMSAQLMRPDRPKFKADDDARTGSTEEKIAAYDGYTAYYGTYTVNEADHTVIHHVEASLYPNWIGSDQLRKYEFSGDRLTLRVVSSGGERRLVWERVR
jgi:Lipocalin-like domain